MNFKLFTLLSTVLFLSCSDILVPESEENLNIEDFEAAWSRIDRIYPLFEFKNINWDSIHTVYRARVELMEGDEIYSLLYDLVAELKDGHAKIYTKGGDDIRPYTPPRFRRDDKAFDPNLIRKYFDKPLLIIAENAMEYEFISKAIGYVRLSTFGKAMRLNVDDIDIVIEHFSNATGVIIDIRDNDGGTSSAYDPIIGRFIKTELSTESAFGFNGKRVPYKILPQGKNQFTGPIIILQNGASFSAGEIFPSRMRQLDYVTLVGDTTAGASVGANATPDPRYFLPSGKSIKINYEAILDLEGKPIEWNGVAPDIRVQQTESDIKNGRDLQLEKAVELLSGN